MMKNMKLWQTRIMRAFGMIAALLSVVACNPGNEGTSKPHIIGGSENETKFPGVVEFKYWPNWSDSWQTICTGTFVRHDLVLTAAHCKSNLEQTRAADDRWYAAYVENDYLASAKRIRTFEVHPDADKIYFDELRGLLDLNYTYADLAFIRFPAHTASPDMITKVASAPAAVDDPVTMIGYGYADPYDTASAGVRRIGENVVDDFNENKSIISILGAPTRESFDNDPSLGAATQPGDSGSPLFNAEGEIIGILSAGGQIVQDNRRYDKSSYANLSYPRANQFIQSVLASDEAIESQPSSAESSSEGEEAFVSKEFPSAVQLSIPNGTSVGTCAGAFIRRDILLTSATCFAKKPVNIYIGTTLIEDIPGSTDYIVHPDFVNLSSSDKWDINDLYSNLAIVRFKEDVVPASMVATLASSEPVQNALTGMVSYGATNLSGDGLYNRRTEEHKLNTIMWDAGLFETIGRDLFQPPFRISDVYGTALWSNHGSPLYNSKGELMGILVAVNEGGTELGSFFVNLADKRVRSFIENVD